MNDLILEVWHISNIVYVMAIDAGTNEVRIKLVVNGETASDTTYQLEPIEINGFQDLLEDLDDLPINEKINKVSEWFRRYEY